MFFFRASLLSGQISRSPKPKITLLKREFLWLSNDLITFSGERDICLEKKNPTFSHKFAFRKAQHSAPLKKLVNISFFGFAQLLEDARPCAKPNREKSGKSVGSRIYFKISFSRGLLISVAIQARANESRAGRYSVCSIFLFSALHKALYLLWCQRPICETEDRNFH